MLTCASVSAREPGILILSAMFTLTDGRPFCLDKLSINPAHREREREGERKRERESEGGR